MPENKNDNFKNLFRVLPIMLGAAGLGMFFLTVFTDKEPPIQSLYWFLLVIGAFILPYVKEVTFGDLRVTLQKGLKKQQKELAETRAELEKQIQASVSAALEKVRQVDEEFGEIRNELIKGYQIYLTECLKSEEDRFEKVGMLNKMYWGELQISISYLKTLLQKGGFYNESIDDHYSKELVNAIKLFQKSQGMVPDGVFGHNSLKNLEKSIHPKE